jgi:hypothetical protein
LDHNSGHGREGKKEKKHFIMRILKKKIDFLPKNECLSMHSLTTPGPADKADEANIGVISFSI